MPRTTYHLQDPSIVFTVRAVRISTANTPTPVSVTTVSSRAPRHHDVQRMPMVEYIFDRWPVPQPHVHDCDVVYKGTRFRIFFQRHKRLPRNSNLFIHGNVIVMRVGKRNISNVVNLRKGDHRRARVVATSFAPRIAWFQECYGRRLNRLTYL
ncbi:hypothetical protein L218DRAFT_520936 [Marasmius fiardii PR-910]|nr:hypothetical protein L218DRAFT_520936 [Marasmius fiardii PR-910]